jgi:anti-repressor protein
MNNEFANILPIQTVSVGRSVNARDLHKALDVGRDFSHWIKARLSEVEAVEDQDFAVVDGTLNSATGELEFKNSRIEYAISLDIAKEIAMLERNERGKAIRRYFIDCERQIKITPQSLTRADLARMILEAETELEQARTENAINAPKVEAFDEIVSSTGLMSVAQAAKLLGTGEVRLFAILRARGVLMSREVSGEANHNVPYQRHLDAGQFEIKVRTTTLTSGRQILTSTTYVTGSGLEYIRKLLRAAQPELNHASLECAS